MSKFSIATSVSESRDVYGCYEVRVLISRELMEFYSRHPDLLRDSLSADFVSAFSACYEKDSVTRK